jgi:V/A-type H+/Na+-transporting ATPase subunit E
MERLQESKDKIKKICDILKKETLEPAKQEAKEIVENAKMQADEILLNAKKEAEKIYQATQEEREKQKKIFEASLNLACRQAIDGLKEQIKNKLFYDNLLESLQIETQKPSVIAKLIQVIVEAIQKEGIDSDLAAYIPKNISVQEINDQLLSQVKDKLQDKSVALGDFYGGVKITLIGPKITLDMTDEAIRDIVAYYVQRDFRERLFAL